MTILGRGDLSPRRRARRRGPVVVSVLVAGVVAAAGWFGWRAAHHGHGGTRATVRTCVTPTPSPTPPAATAVSVAVLNATERVGLAHQVAAALRARGFHVRKVGNTSSVLAGVGDVTYGPGGRAAAVAVAEQVAGATVNEVPSGGVTLELGPSFSALAAPAQVAAAHARDVAAASPRPAVCTGS